MAKIKRLARAIPENKEASPVDPEALRALGAEAFPSLSMMPAGVSERSLHEKMQELAGARTLHARQGREAVRLREQAGRLKAGSADQLALRVMAHDMERAEQASGVLVKVLESEVESLARERAKSISSKTSD